MHNLLKRSAMVAAASAATLTMGAAPALADDGSAYSTSYLSWGAYQDGGDQITACDIRHGDGISTFVQFAVQQADGSYDQRRPVTARNGCTYAVRDVLREQAWLSLTVWDQHSDGRLTNARHINIRG